MKFKKKSLSKNAMESAVLNLCAISLRLQCVNVSAVNAAENNIANLDKLTSQLLHNNSNWNMTTLSAIQQYIYSIFLYTPL